MGAENLCHQAIFVNHASCAVTPLYPEMGQVDDAVGQRAERRGLWVPVIHPCWSGSMPVLVENPAEAVVSLYMEAGGGVGLEDW